MCFKTPGKLEDRGCYVIVTDLTQVSDIGSSLGKQFAGAEIVSVSLVKGEDIPPQHETTEYTYEAWIIALRQDLVKS